MATAAQAFSIAVKRNADGISMVSWLLFGLANIGLYIYTEKYLSIQSLAGLLLTAAIDFVIVGQCIFYRQMASSSVDTKAGPDRTVQTDA